MNGVKRETFISIVNDKEAGGLIYDGLSEIYDIVENQPTKCDKKYLKRKHAIYAVIGVICFLIGLGLLQIETVASFMP